jgi:hypothetical protein
MFDALNYHLAFPARWLAAGGFVEFPAISSRTTRRRTASSTASPLPRSVPGSQLRPLVVRRLAVLAAAELGSQLGGRRAATWATACFGLTPWCSRSPVTPSPTSRSPLAGAALVALLRP